MKNLANRFIQMFVTLIGVSFLTFCLTYLAPGDPAAMLLETADTIISEEVLQRTREELGLDQPFFVQYGKWLSGVFHGDLGISYSAKKPVTEKLSEGFIGTISLTIMTVFLVLIISIPLGACSAVNQNGLLDYLIRFFSFIGVSIPNFCLGLILLYMFALKLHWFPVVSSTFTFKGIILPAITLAIYQSSKYIRQVRTIILEELNQDYVIGARARGLSNSRILWRHILPNAILPLITLLGMSIGWLLGGVAIIETVFSWPGMGNMAVRAILMRDYPLLEGFVLWISTIYMIINFLVDCSYSYLNPKLRRKEQD